MSLKDGFDTAKSFFDALKGFAAVAIVILLVIDATSGAQFFAQAISRLGFTEGDIFGFKWKSGFVDAEAKLKDVQETAQRLKTDLDAAKHTIETQTAALAALQSGDSSAAKAKASEAAQKADATLAQIGQSTSVASTLIKSVQVSLDANSQLRQQAQAAVAPSSVTWGVVTGGDPAQKDAEDEVAKARIAGYATVRLYKRQDWYRTVIEFDSVASASSARDGIRSVMKRPDAYVVNLATWCPARPNAPPPIVNCDPH